METALSLVLPSLLVLQTILAFLAVRKARNDCRVATDAMYQACLRKMEFQPRQQWGAWNPDYVTLLPPREGIRGDFPEGDVLPEKAVETIRDEFDKIDTRKKTA